MSFTSSSSSHHKRGYSGPDSDALKKAKSTIDLPPLGRHIPTYFLPNDIRVPATGYTGGTKTQKVKNTPPPPEENLELLQQNDWNYIRWTGEEARPILDRHNRSIGILGGIPQGDIYQEHCQEGRRLMMKLGKEGPFTKEQKEHLRGFFPALNFGVAFGPGQTEPHNLRIASNQVEVVQQLLTNESIQYLAQAQDAMFKQWVPRLHAYYEKCFETIWHNRPSLKKNFAGSVWPTAAFNLAKQVTSRRHKDSQNLVYGICAITSLGYFDSSKGGHLVLPDLRMVIEFPAGAIILIPSALLTHANTPVRPGEERMSFTQYSAGGHFRYVDYDCQTMKEAEESDKSQFEKVQGQAETNGSRGWGMYSTMEELGTYPVD